MEPIMNIYNQYEYEIHTDRVVVPKEIDTMFHEAFGQSRNIKFFKPIKRRKHR